jgi:iron complex transport system permease protein
MASETGSAGTATDPANGWRGLVDSSLVMLCLGSTLVVLAAGLVQVSFGAYTMTLGEAWRAVLNPEVLFDLDVWQVFLLGGTLNAGWLLDPLSEPLILDASLPEMNRRSLIVWNIRMPRVFVAVLAGTTLAVSGAIFQAVTRNELASPFVLGVSSGAGFTVLLTLVVFSSLAPFLPILATVGGTVAFLLVYFIAWKDGTSPVRLVLAGVIVNMVFQSLQRALFFFADDLGTVQSALAWITGSLTGVDWGEFRIAILPSILAVLLALAGARQLNVLLLGERTASSLGMRVERMRFLMSGVAILAASVSIAVAGIIGFFGLVVPHVVRLVVGSDYRRLLVGCVFAGPALMVAADVGARLGMQLLAGSDAQMPVGIVTGLVGGPYFLYLMRKQEQMGEI